MSNLDLQKLTDEQIAQIKEILASSNTNEQVCSTGTPNSNNEGKEKSLEELFERDAKGNIKCRLVDTFIKL